MDAAARSTTRGAAVEPRARARSGRRGARLGGRGRRGPAPDERASSRDAVDAAAGCCAAAGVGPGDRVGIFLPMLAETVVAVLALGRLGAIYTPIFSGYGAPGRRRPGSPTARRRVLITADGFLRRGGVGAD